VRRGGSRAQERGQRGRPGADSRLAARGLVGSSTRYQRWRRAGLLPRHERRGAGRGTARPPCSPPRLWEIAAALARHAGQGRDLRVAIVAWFFEAGRPVALDEPLSRSR